MALRNGTQWEPTEDITHKAGGAVVAEIGPGAERDVATASVRMGSVVSLTILEFIPVCKLSVV